MAYYLLDDQFADDPVWDALSAGKTALLDAIQAAFLRLCSKAAHQLTDGYLTEAMATRYCKPAVLDALTRAVLCRPPRLHRPGDECECLGDSWIDGFAYRIHRYLRRNPSKAEYNRNRAQKADLRDPRLKHAAYQRDGGCCRYCRSGPLSPKAVRAKDRRKLLHYDHVDPDQPAGPDAVNLVTACANCNEHKGHRTPDEADMALLDPPAEPLRLAWLARTEPTLFDRGEAPDHRPNQNPITTESPTNHRSDQNPVTDPVTDTKPDQNTETPAQTTPDTSHHTPEQPPTELRKGAGTGRGGNPDPDPAPTRPATPRTPEAPDIYTKRSRTPNPAPRPATAPQQPRPRCIACHEPLDPIAGSRVHPLCDEAAGWPPGAQPTRPTMISTDSGES